MPRVKHAARKDVAGSSARAPTGTGSDSEGQRHPFKRTVPRPPSPQLPSSSDGDGSDFEDELAAEDLAEQPADRRSMPKPGTRRASYMPPPPPAQPAGEARRISLEPPATLGREVTNFTTLAKSSYLTFCATLINSLSYVTLRTHVSTHTSRRTFLLQS